MNTAALKITNNETSRKPARKPARKGATVRKLRTGEKVRATAFFGLASAGLAVSLPHLASEVSALTGAGVMATWMIAIVIDLGMVCCKAHLSAGGHNKNVAWTVVGACTAVSIVLNAHAFMMNASEGFGQVAAVGFGFFLPLFILALSYLGSEILNGKR